MRILITTVRVPFISGGAEILAAQLKHHLLAAGHEAEIVEIPFKWYPPEKILDQMLACRLLDLSESCYVGVDRVIGLKFPAYLIPHPNKVLWILHQHRQAYDLWESGDLRQQPNGSLIRDTIIQADRNLLPEAKSIFTIAENVSQRLQKYCGIASTPLYNPPLGAEDYFCGEDRGYFFFPSRLNPGSKRQGLVLQALALTKEPVRILFAGAPDVPGMAVELQQLTETLGLGERVEWRGNVSEEEKRNLYAHARGVVFPPDDEDYGYVTLEAMLAAKPVVTCSDSGGALEFVRHRETGLVTAPEPEKLAEALDEIWQNPVKSKEWGEAGRVRYDSLGISWENVIKRLLA
jgi:glycosyltransferase involved in cell wall biosynthesis